MTTLVTFMWTGDVMAPLGRHKARCAEAFKAGEMYRMEVQEERSWRSHRHYFAALYEGWLNLPERYALESWAQTSEHLRKYALIRTGWHDGQDYPCSSNAEAQRLAAAIRPLDTYCIVLAKGAMVTRFTAKSQSVKAMGKEAFQQSKDDVLSFVADLAGVTPAQLGSAA